MNVFFLDQDPEKAAIYMVDRHVVKMAIEYAQLLSAAHIILDGVDSDGIYKLTHKNHPSSIWTRQTNNNYLWLKDHWIYTLREYSHRYGKTHASAKLVDRLRELPKNISLGPWTNPPLAMPDEYKASHAVDSYRNYYIKGKSHIHKWTNREKPVWID